MAGSVVGFTEPAVRVALSRMVAAGDLVREGEAAYRLSDRLLARQRRQEAAVHPETLEWHGTWDLYVVTTTGRSASDRADLRDALAGLRLAEVREGVWTRPSNLVTVLPDQVSEVVESFVGAAVQDSAQLAARLWDLEGWADRARALLAATATDDPVLRFTACATSGRHLLADPVLPGEVLPEDWPSEDLRRSHVAYKEWLVDMRRSLVGQG